MDVTCQLHVPPSLPPTKEPKPTGKEAGWAPRASRVVVAKSSLSLLVIESWSPSPQLSHYTYWDKETIHIIQNTTNQTAQTALIQQACDILQMTITQTKNQFLHIHGETNKDFSVSVDNICNSKSTKWVKFRHWKYSKYKVLNSGMQQWMRLKNWLFSIPSSHPS